MHINKNLSKNHITLLHHDLLLINHNATAFVLIEEIRGYNIDISTAYIRIGWLS